MPALYSLVVQLLQLYIFLIIAWVVLSWLQALKVLPYSRGLHTVMSLLYQLTEPALRPIRRVLPSFGGIDFSPLVVIIAIEIIIALLHDLLL